MQPGYLMSHLKVEGRLTDPAMTLILAVSSVTVETIKTTIKDRLVLNW